MFALEQRHWWYRALRRQILHALTDFPILSMQGVAQGAGRGVRCPDADRGVGGPHADRGVRCLDAGCGTGMNLTTLNERFQVFGLDISHLALSLAAKRGLPHLAQGSVEAIPFESATMDLIISADVLYHRGVSDDLGALREMARCLRPGGLIVLNLPAFSWLRSRHDDVIHTARRYTRTEVERKLRRAGLEPLRVRYWNWLLFLPLALIRILRRMSPSARAERCTETLRGQAPIPGGARSDLVALPAWINRAMDGLLALEAHLMALPIPAGLSIIAVARKGEKLSAIGDGGSARKRSNPARVIRVEDMRAGKGAGRE
ncbi:MAG: class I SAM-dependent methyltransferase [Candidatus Eisenbacteria sp.]|nr:class I SAM-dependent methyltransferase [Candidatus Eisenbacteria bacterium]